jgi:integrase
MLDKMGISDAYFLCTGSPSSGIIRNAIVGLIVGFTDGTHKGRLTALKVRRAKRPGMYADGGGLYLQVSERGASWILRYMLNKRAREMGLGPVALFSLAEARTKALEARKLRHEGIDPIEARRAARAQLRLDAAKAMTFQQCAEAHIKAQRAGWRNGKHAAQWEATLAKYAGPIIGALPVGAINTALVLKVLEPIWTAKPETASRLRGRMEAALDWAKARGYRQGENPARWRGHLDKLLPAPAKVRKVEHHAALPYAELPGFMVALREHQGIVARALEFAILTAGRTGEVIGARWSEIDLLDKTWTVPAGRMKAGKEHRVPLSARVLAILEEMQGHHSADDGFVFAGGKPGQPLSNMAFLMLLRRMGRGDLTTHGFRSTFRDWVAERTSFPSDVAELALAHAVRNPVEAAYRRGDMFEKRRRLMDAWATFCTTVPTERGKVVALQGR